MPWIDAVYGRTQEDITNLTSKAFFNVVDWVRIENNTVYVRAVLNVLRSLNIEYNVVSEPDISTIPSADDINQFVDNIEHLRIIASLPVSSGIVVLKTDWLGVTSAPTVDFEVVNDWERNLQIIKNLTISISTYLVFCGVASVGQSRLWQNRFRNMFILPSRYPVRRARMLGSPVGSGLVRQNKFRRYDL